MNIQSLEMLNEAPLQITGSTRLYSCINKTLSNRTNQFSVRNLKIYRYSGVVYHNPKNLTSRPAMQWKKKSCGWIPVINLPSINPPDLGDVSNTGKLGNVRPDIINGGRLPSNSIWPKQQEICMVFTVEPLAPELTMSCRLFSGNLLRRPAGRHILDGEEFVKFCWLFFFIENYGCVNPLLINSVVITVQCRFILTIEHGSEFGVFIICLFHMAGKNI